MSSIERAERFTERFCGIQSAVNVIHMPVWKTKNRCDPVSNISIYNTAIVVYCLARKSIPTFKQEGDSRRQKILACIPIKIIQYETYYCDLKLIKSRALSTHPAF